MTSAEILIYAVLVVCLGFIAYFVWDSIRVLGEEAIKREKNASVHEDVPQHSAPFVPAAYESHPNEKFLHAVRSRSCYPMLRDAHAVLTFVAVIATFIMWIVLGSNTSGAATAYATFMCGAVIVALLIEYGLFRLIVDAVDVLIDTGRRAAGEQTEGA